VGVVRPATVSAGGPADVGEERRKQRAQTVREVEIASDSFFQSDDEDGEANDGEPGGASPAATAAAGASLQSAPPTHVAAPSRAGERTHTANGSTAPQIASTGRTLPPRVPAGVEGSAGARSNAAGAVDDAARRLLQQESALFREMLDVLDDVIGGADDSENDTDDDSVVSGTDAAVDKGVRIGHALTFGCLLQEL